MLSPVQGVRFNSQTPIQKTEQQKYVKTTNNQNNSVMLLKTLDCMSAVSFGSLQSKASKAVSENLSSLMADVIPTGFSPYDFLRRNPLGFYLEYGRDVNSFLRTGTFKPLPELSDDLPDGLRRYVEDKIVEAKNLNRTIYESVDVLKSKMTSTTDKPMVVWRDAPRSWMNTAKGGKLTDDAFLSVSTERGASMEGMICNGADNFTYEIHLPAGVKYWDLTRTSEKEMVLLPGRTFEVLSDGVLKMEL